MSWHVFCRCATGHLSLWPTDCVRLNLECSFTGGLSCLTLSKKKDSLTLLSSLPPIAVEMCMTSVERKLTDVHTVTGNCERRTFLLSSLMPDISPDAPDDSNTRTTRTSSRKGAHWLKPFWLKQILLKLVCCFSTVSFCAD